MLIRKNENLPIHSLQPSRRNFLKAGIVAGAGLVIGVHLPSGRMTSAQAAEVGSPFEGYVRISPENKVTVLAAHLDMGQGIYTGTATLVAEELDADWSQMEVEGGSGNPKLYGNLAFGGKFQGTGGSTATMSSFDRYRRAGATARIMLVSAAARQWNVPASEIKVEKGVVSHSSGKKATF